MINQQLLDFIKQQLSSGSTKEKISSDLLANGWTAQDVQEGFNALTIPATPVSSVPSTPATPSFVQKKSHSGMKIFFTVLVLFLLAGGASAYYFKDRLVKLPIIQFFPSQEIAPVQPQAVDTIDYTPTTNPRSTNNTPVTNPVTATINPAQTSNGVLDCGIDTNCFIKASQNCSKSSVEWSSTIDLFGLI